MSILHGAFRTGCPPPSAISSQRGDVRIDETGNREGLLRGADLEHLETACQRDAAFKRREKDKFKACVDWYHANLDSLLPQYYGRYVACTENGVVASGGSMLLAAENAIDSGYPQGTFAVHKCLPADEEEIAYFHTPRVDFSRRHSGGR